MQQVVTAALQILAAANTQYYRPLNINKLLPPVLKVQTLQGTPCRQMSTHNLISAFKLVHNITGWVQIETRQATD